MNSYRCSYHIQSRYEWYLLRQVHNFVVNTRSIKIITTNHAAALDARIIN